MNRAQSGFTLVEMMISSLIGSLAMAGAISVFTVTVKNNGDGLKRVRLGQELRTIMDVMTRDIRRAGYWENADGITANPFATLSVNNNCVTYSYDFNGNALPQNEDRFGFKFDNSAVKYRQNGAACNSNNDWILISDPNTISITNLNFNLSTICENLSNSLDDQSCSNAVSNDVLSYMYQVDITLNGELISDNTVTYSLSESVAIRNSNPQIN